VKAGNKLLSFVAGFHGLFVMKDSIPELASQPTYWLARFVMLRLLGAIYAIAFLVAINQIVPLIGEHGLLPVGIFLDRIGNAFGSSSAGFFRLPSLFWFAHSDRTLLIAA
jgi:hypothetical protein